MPRVRRPLDALPLRQEPGQGVRRDRLDLLAQLGERPAAQRAQDLGVAPLEARAAGPELAVHDAAGRRQPGQRGVDDGRRRGRTSWRRRRAWNGPCVRA